jgi:hypothetical protein
MGRQSRAPSLIGSVKRLFRSNKYVSSRIRKHEDWYANYYFPENQAEGIALVARIENTSKKKAANMLMGQALAAYIGRKTKDFIDIRRQAQAADQPLQLPPDLRLLRRYFNKQGLDIRKIT